MSIEEYAETKEVKECGNSAHVLLPRKLLGKTVRIELVDDDE